MRFEVIACMILVVAVNVSAGKWKGWGRKQYSKERLGCEGTRDRIQIYYPHGLEVYMESNGLKSFGVEVYINQEEKAQRSCDVCSNTTIVDQETNMFIIKDPMAVIRPGERFGYTLIKHYYSGVVRRYKCKPFFVNERRVSSWPEFDSQTIVSTNTTNTDTSSQQILENLNTNKQTLENIINEFASNCTNMFITNMLVLADYKEVATNQELKSFALNRLTTLLPTIHWSDIVENVYRSDGNIVFEVKTILDKIKILQRINKSENVANVLVNFDTMERSSYDDDYDA